MSNTKLHIQIGLISLVFGISLILSACNHTSPKLPTSQEPGAGTPSTTPLSIITPTIDLIPSPTPQTQTWEFTETCRGAPVVKAYPLGNGFWSLNVNDQSLTKNFWDFSREDLASQFHWRALQPFELFDPSFHIAFLGTDQDQKSWIGYLYLNCAGTIQLEVILPVENPDHAFLKPFWNESLKRYEYWLIDGKKLTVFIAKNKMGQAITSTSDVPNTALSINAAETINIDSRSEYYLFWWDKYGSSEFNERNISLIQIYRLEYYGGYTLIGEIDPSWQSIDLMNDGKMEFLKPSTGGPIEKWEIYAYQGVVYGWDGEITLPAPQAPIAVNLDLLPPLPNDLYFAKEDKGWIWPKNGGQLHQVPIRPRVTKIVSACSGKEIDFQDQNLWSPGCRYKLIEIPGQIEGTSSAVIDLHTGEEIPIPNSNIYAVGFNTFAWDSQDKYLIHARSDWNPGLYRIDLPSGEVSTLLAFPIEGPPYLDGAFYPTILRDGSIIFMVRSTNPNHYPPPGIYRLMPGGELRYLVAVNPLVWNVDITFSNLFPAPDGTLFLYGEHVERTADPKYLYLLIVSADGKKVWDATAVLKNSHDFRWLP